MTSEGVVIRASSVLMVREYVDRGDLVWNFPGGGGDDGEMPEQTCVREFKEETGYDVRVLSLLCERGERYTYIVAIVGGELLRKSEWEDCFVEMSWVDLSDDEKFDFITQPVREMCLGKV